MPSPAIIYAAAARLRFSSRLAFRRCLVRRSSKFNPFGSWACFRALITCLSDSLKVKKQSESSTPLRSSDSLGSSTVCPFCFFHSRIFPFRALFVIISDIFKGFLVRGQTWFFWSHKKSSFLSKLWPNLVITGSFNISRVRGHLNSFGIASSVSSWKEEERVVMPGGFTEFVHWRFRWG